MFISIGSRAGRNRRVWGVSPLIDQSGKKTAFDLEIGTQRPTNSGFQNTNQYLEKISLWTGATGVDYGGIAFGGQFSFRPAVMNYGGGIGIGWITANNQQNLPLNPTTIIWRFGTSFLDCTQALGGYSINSDSRLVRNNAVGALATVSNSDATGASFAVYGLGGLSAGGGTFSNYSRVTISAAAGGGATIATESSGSGAAGSISLDTPSSVRIIRSAANTGGNLTIVGGAGSNTSGSIGNTWALGVTGTDGTTYTAGIRADGFVSGTAIGTSDGNTAAFDQVSTPKGTKVCNTGMFTFSSGGAWWQTIDLAFARNAAGVAEVNNGTASSASLANLRDLKLRNLIFADGTSLSAIPTVSADPLAMSNIYGGL